MPAVAAIFLVLVAARVVLLTLDPGLGGKVWVAIVWVSCLAWPLGVVMALDFLGLWPNIDIHLKGLI